jgi:hypothetical protein
MLDTFLKDEDITVRKTFASFFEDLCKLLGTNAFKHLGDALKVFLGCEDEQIITVIYKNLASILIMFQAAETPKLQVYMDGIFAIIVETRKAFDEKPNIGWRTHEIILRSMECFPMVFDNDSVYDNLVGTLQKLLVEVLSSLK